MNSLNYLFAKYQKLLLRLANNRFGRKFLDLQTKEKIVGIVPNAIAFRKGNKFEGHFYCGKDVFAEKLGLALTALDILEFKELRALMHYCGLTKNDFAYPLLAFATTNINCGAGAGDIHSGFLATWNECHDLVTGSVASYNANTLQVQSYGGVDVYRIQRGFLPTDTSALGAGATVSACIFKGYVTTVTNTAWADYFTLVGATTQASFTELVIADFDQCGSVDNPTTWSDNVSSFTTNAYNDWTFNATGLTNVSLTSYTAVGLRSEKDILDVDPLLHTPLEESTIIMNGSGNASNKPYLAITYTPAPAGGAFLLNFM